MEQKSSSLPEDLMEKSLCICSMDSYSLGNNFSYRYSIQAIKMSELFSFSEAPFTIMFQPHPATTKFSPMFDEKDKKHALQEIDFLESDDNGVPYRMGVGVFRSQIVFAGGRQYPNSLFSGRLYALDTKQVRMRIRQAKDQVCSDHFSIPFLQSPKAVPKLMEIKGKFYALDLRFQSVYCESGTYHCFEVFDPNIGSWASLPDPPPVIMEGSDSSDYLSYLVAGTKILVANFQTPVYGFDVEGPTQKWEKLRVRYFCGGLNMPMRCDDRQLPNWDSIDLDLGDHMLAVYMVFDTLHFFRLFSLSNGSTAAIQYVATIDVNVKFDLSTHFTYLGGGIICCVFMDAVTSGPKVRGVIFTFKISFSRSAADSTPIIPVSSTDDPFFKIIYPPKPTRNCFTAKTLGWRTFEYQYTRTSVSLTASEFVGLAVLPLHHDKGHGQGHAFCKACGSYFSNTQYLNQHLSTNENCRTELPRVKCRFCNNSFPKRELHDHIQTSQICKLKFYGDGG